MSEIDQDQTPPGRAARPETPARSGDERAGPGARSAVLDEAHVGDIRGALGTIREDDLGPRRGLSARLKTLVAIIGPGLIVMVGDNDAGAFSTYTQAGQNYGTSLFCGRCCCWCRCCMSTRRWSSGSARSPAWGTPA